MIQPHDQTQTSEVWPVRRSIRLVWQSAETWRSIPEYEGFYEASSSGRIRSVDRIDSNGHRLRGRVLKQQLHHSGKLIYRHVCLSREGKVILRLVHDLVASAFTGRPRAEGEQTRHRNHNPSDNRAANLVFGTPSENQQDSVRDGRHWPSTKTHCPKNHPYDDTNTLLYHHYGYRHRICRACRADRYREGTQRKRLLKM